MLPLRRNHGPRLPFAHDDDGACAESGRELCLGQLATAYGPSVVLWSSHKVGRLAVLTHPVGNEAVERLHMLHRSATLVAASSNTLAVWDLAACTVKYSLNGRLACSKSACRGLLMRPKPAWLGREASGVLAAPACFCHADKQPRRRTRFKALERRIL